MYPSSDLPQVHNIPRFTAPRHINRGESTRNTFSDLPPPYSLIYEPTTPPAIEDALPRLESEDGTLLEVLDHDYFKDKTTRIAFIQKVLALKLLQLLCICGIMSVFLANSLDVIRFMTQWTVSLIVVSSLVFIVTFGLMVVCENARRKTPVKYMFLVAYPLFLSLLISVWTIYWHLLAPIFLAFIYYCVVILALLLYSIFACQTELKFVTKYGIMLAIGTHMVLFAATVPFLYISAFKVLCPTILMIFEYIYVLFNIEAMTSTNYWSIITPADFVVGAINLHIDYYNIVYNWASFKMSHDWRRFGHINETPDL